MRPVYGPVADPWGHGNILIPQKAGYFLTGGLSIRFWSTILFNEVIDSIN